MALKNRDRVGRAFEALAAGLHPYVDRRMAARAGQAQWLDAFVASARPPIRGVASLDDPALLLRVLTDTWDAVFRAELARADRSIAFELRDIRNHWAHNSPFDHDDTYRTLDSIERLLVSVDAAEAAEVGESKEELMRLRYEAMARKAVPSSTALLTEPTRGLAPWREVVQPHDDVVRGRFDLAEFAADLWQVHLRKGAAEYHNPIQFFERTYLTEGLRALLAEAVERITSSGGSPIVDLQTTFGGGKTHSMIALRHLFSGVAIDALPQEVQSLVLGLDVTALPSVRQAVLVGTELSPGQPTVHDGQAVNTMWGELAWQLGQAEGYALVAEADRTGTNPGGALRTLLERYSPCLILVDEWVAYARGLYGDDSLVGGTFDNHFTFAQALTEAVKATSGALLVVSLPAPTPSDPSSDDEPIGSEHEVGGAGGRETLRRLRAVIGRMESSWRPATAEESFEIVRRRLFQEPDADALARRDATAKAFADLYRKQKTEFPAECREKEYEERIKRAYPIHPELFARLYEDWSTLERFQRTRGVLRLMANVVQSLWASGDQSPLILPGLVPLSDTTVVTELTRNLDDAWKPIIDTDVDGPGSLPDTLDNEVTNLGRYRAAHRVARSVFLGSAPLVHSANRGLDAARVRLACSVPGDAVAIYSDALTRLADQGTYFFAANARYWYGTQPGLGRLARDRSERFLAVERRPEVRDHIVELLRRHTADRAAFDSVHVAPDSPADVTDTAAVRLVVMRPSDVYVARSQKSEARTSALEILGSRGSAPRDFRNMLVFLAPDHRGIEDLELAMADHLAWRSIDQEQTELDLGQAQLRQVTERVADTERTVRLRLEAAYQWVLVPRQPTANGEIEIEAVKVDGDAGLATRAAAKLGFDGYLYSERQPYPRAFLADELDGVLSPLLEAGSVTVGDLWDNYARRLYLRRLANVDVLTLALAGLAGSTSWSQDGVGLADGVGADGLYQGLVGGAVVSSLRADSLVVRRDVADRQLAEERAAEYDHPDADWPPTNDAPGDSNRNGRSTVTPETTLRRFHASVRLDPARLAVEAGRLNTEVLSHLSGLEGTEMEVTIEVQARRPEGFPTDIVRVVDENASALRFDDHGFETT